MNTAMVRWRRIVLTSFLVLATSASISAQAEDVRETVTVPASQIPSSEDQPPCSDVNPITIGQVVANYGGDELAKQTGKSSDSDAVRKSPIGPWLNERLGLNNGK